MFSLGYKLFVVVLFFFSNLLILPLLILYWRLPFENTLHCKGVKRCREKEQGEKKNQQPNKPCFIGVLEAVQETILILFVRPREPLEKVKQEEEMAGSEGREDHEHFLGIKLF